MKQNMITGQDYLKPSLLQRIRSKLLRPAYPAKADHLLLSNRERALPRHRINPELVLTPPAKRHDGECAR